MIDWINQIVLDGFQVFLFLESLVLLLNQTLISPLVVLFGIKRSSIFELEDLLLDVRCLIILRVPRVRFLEVKLIQVISMIS
jgi:hypothetical protein